MLKEKPASRRISARRTEAEARMSFMGVTGDWRKGLQLSVVSLQLKEKKKQYWGVAGIQTQYTRRHRTLAAYDFLRRYCEYIASEYLRRPRDRKSTRLNSSH